jgi:hypothetical protein
MLLGSWLNKLLFYKASSLLKVFSYLACMALHMYKTNGSIFSIPSAVLHSKYANPLAFAKAGGVRVKRTLAL